MPHLTSDALRQDPEGLAFLRTVLAKPEPVACAALVAVEEPAPPRELVIVDTMPAPTAGPLPAVRAAADAA